MTDIILLSGKQGSGKTTLGKELERLFRGNALGLMRMQFAYPIYQAHDAVYAVMQQFGITIESKKDGELLQVLGTEWGRKKDPDFWVKISTSRMQEIEKRLFGSPVHLVFCFEDARFENEFSAYPDALKVRLECPKDVRRARCEYYRENDQHPSEIGLDKFAAEGRFDYVADTSTKGVAEVAEDIFKLFKRKQLEKP